MLQRGRKSSASLIAPAIDGGPSRLVAPTTLSKAERVVFEQLVGSIDRRHFRESDMPLLCAYVRAIAFEQQAAKQLSHDPTNTKQLALWEKATRALVSLSLRLRLSPQSRLHPKTAERLPPVGKRPWA